MKSVAEQRRCLAVKSINEGRMGAILYAYQNLKLLRGQCKPSESNYIFCGSHIETQEHVLHECEHQAVKQTKQNIHTKQICIQMPTYITDYSVAPPATELFVDGVWIDMPDGIKQVWKRKT